MTKAERRRFLRNYRAALLAGDDVPECVVGLADRCQEPGELQDLLAAMSAVLVEVYTGKRPRAVKGRK